MSDACEIGGYLELERADGSVFHDSAIALNSARNCLRYLIELRDIRSIWIPDYMCDAVHNTCRDCSIAVHTYQVNDKFEPIFDFHIREQDYLYLSDFFGQLTESQVAAAQAYSNGKLIVDEVQGFFRPAWPDVDTLYTCRKFFGVPDGAFLYTADERTLDDALAQDTSRTRVKHLFGRLETTATEYYRAYERSEEAIGHLPLSCMSLTTDALLRRIDYDRVKRQREVNFSKLHEELGNVNRLRLNVPVGPYMYPLFLDDAEKIRAELIQQKIYVPTLWPNVLNDAELESAAFSFARNILPLPIDQRYDCEDMDRILRILRSVL